MDDTSLQNRIYDTAQVNAFVEMLAEGIRKEFFTGKPVNAALIGIQLGGVPLARRISRIIRDKTGFAPEVGTLDISMYRDDIGMRKSLPPIQETRIPFDLNGKVIILTDDVIQTGRSIRAALDAITDFGRPAKIRLAALIDRGLRDFPIRPDFVGGYTDVPAEYRVHTSWAEYTGTDAVYAIPRTSTNTGVN